MPTHRFAMGNALLYILFASGEHGVDEACELIGCFLDCPRFIQTSQTSTIRGADKRLARSRGRGWHTQCLPEPVDRLRCPPG